MSEHLVGSPAFKAGGTGDPRPAGSIPVHLRHGALDTGRAQARQPKHRRMKSAKATVSTSMSNRPSTWLMASVGQNRSRSPTKK